MTRARGLVLIVYVSAGCATVPVTAPPAMPVAAPAGAAQAPGAPAPSIPPPPQSPCDIVAAHNAEMVSQASERALATLTSKAPGALAAHIDALSHELGEYGKRVVTHGKAQRRLDTLSDDELHMAGISPGSDGQIYLSVREKLQTTEAIATALEHGEPLPEALEDEPASLCEPDAKGAWAYWITDAVYAPQQDEMETWRSIRTIRLARVSTAGEVVVSKTFPNFYATASVDPRFATPKDGNCCMLDYGQGPPQVLFRSDQDGDGIPEIALKASIGVEGSYDESTEIYHFKDGAIVEAAMNVSSMRDVDQDGRLDVIEVQRITASDSCGSGFPSYSVSPEYLEHALPDASYSGTDSVAREYLAKQCPSPPRTFTTIDAVFCGKVWSVDDRTMLRSAHRACRRDPCAGDEKIAACANLEFAVKEFVAPITVSVSK